MPLPKEKAWFPAKRYGYGWGFPSRWQGLVVMMLYIVGTVGAAVVFAGAHWSLFFASMAVLTAIMIGICYLKGERAKWRWGDDE